MMQPYPAKFGELGAVTSEITFLICAPSHGYWAKSAYYLYSSCWHFQMRWTTEMSMGEFKAAMHLYISYKFGGLLSSTVLLQLNVNAAQLCTAGIDQHCRLIHRRSLEGSTFVLHYYSGATPLCWAGYTLGFATHF